MKRQKTYRGWTITCYPCTEREVYTQATHPAQGTLLDPRPYPGVEEALTEIKRWIDYWQERQG